MSDSLQPDGLQHMRLPCPSMLNVMSIESVMPSKHLTLCCSLVLLPSIFSNIRDFSNELALQIRWPNYCTFSFSISPPSEYSGLISFRIDWFNLLAVQGTLKNLLQHHNLICGSSVFSKSSLYIWKFLVHVLFIIQCATEEEWRNSSRKNEEAEPKWKGHSVVDVSGGESKVRFCRE